MRIEPNRTTADAPVADPDTYADLPAASEQYARRFRGSVGAWLLETQARSSMELLGTRAGRILDVGGGHGQLALHLLQAGWQVSVLTSSTVLPVAFRNGNAPAVRVVSGGMMDLPFPADSFDAVIALRLMGHVVRTEDFLGELCRVSAGPVIVDYPSTQSVNAFSESFFRLKLMVEGDTRRFRSYAPAEIERAFAAHGYGVSDTRPQFLFPIALHRLMRHAALGRAMEAPGRISGLRAVFGSPVIVRADPLSPIASGEWLRDRAAGLVGADATSPAPAGA